MKKPEKPPVENDIVNTKGIINLSLFSRNNPLYKQLSELEDEYLYWEELKHKAKRLDIDVKELWINIRKRRSFSQRELIISKLNGFYFTFNYTNQIQEALHRFDFSFGSAAIKNNEDKERYLINSIMEEAIASSQLEGAVTTREVAKEMLLKERKPRNYSENMIANNYEAIRKILEWKGRPITKERILELHAIVTKDTLKDDGTAGKWRLSDDVNVVDDITGEIFYTPPLYRHLDGLMDEFCAFAGKKIETKDFMHPIVRAIILHFLIGYIHPFTDGNGRTARAIFYWYLINEGYWLVEYLAISRIILRSPAKYARAYLHTEYDDNDLTYFINYNVEAMTQALQELHEYIQRKASEKSQIYNVVKQGILNERQLVTIRLMMDKPETILTVKEVQNRFGVAYETARTDLMGLAELKYLEQKMQGKKMIFFRSANFDKIIKKQ